MIGLSVRDRAEDNQDKTMNKNIILAVPFGLTATALVLSLRSSVSVELVVGLGSILVLLGVFALEYRITWKSLFGRG